MEPLLTTNIQGDPAPCSKPPVDIELKLRFSIRTLYKTKFSHQCQREVWKKVLDHPVVKIRHFDKSLFVTDLMESILIHCNCKMFRSGAGGSNGTVLRHMKLVGRCQFVWQELGIAYSSRSPLTIPKLISAALF